MKDINCNRKSDFVTNGKCDSVTRPSVKVSYIMFTLTYSTYNFVVESVQNKFTYHMIKKILGKSGRNSKKVVFD